MLLYEVLSSGSIVDWFIDSINHVYRNAYQRAESMYNNTGDARSAKMQAGMVIGKWYSQNVITHGTYSINDLVNTLKPHTIKIPDILTTSRQKEEQGYSSSRNLQNLVTGLIPILQKRGYVTQAKILANAQNTFITKMEKLLASDPDDDIPQQTRPKQRSNIGSQHNQANQIVQDAISRLPTDIRHSVRTAVAARGNTIAALSAELQRRGIQL